MLRQASAKRIKLVTMMAFVAIPLSGFVTDIYLPSFPAMAKDLMVSEKDIQLTLTCYLLSYGISQLFVGNILDSIGRYHPKIIALTLLTISSLLISFTNNINLICILRVIQGFTIAVVVVANRAIFMDLYDAEKAKHYLSYITIIWSLGPILAPFLGGFLEKAFSWHANFYFLAGYSGLLLLFEIFFSGESLEEKKRINFSENLSLYKTMIQNKVFMLGIFILGFSYSIVMLFNITGPFIIENTFHFSPVTIGYCTLILGFSWTLGGIIAKRRMHLNFDKRILLPSFTQLLFIGALSAVSFFYEQLYIMIAFAFFIHIFSGVLFTSFFTTSMMYFPKNAGTAGGLMGGLVYIITSITSSIISVTGNVTTQGALSSRYMIFSVLLILVVLRMRKVLSTETNTLN